jgi:hypothetical protein
MPYRKDRKSVVVALLLLTILTSCSLLEQKATASIGAGLCETYEPLRLSPATKAFLDTDDPAISLDRKAMADNNRVWKCLCTDEIESC